MRLYDPAGGSIPDVQFGLCRNKRTGELVESKGLAYEGTVMAMVPQDGTAIEISHDDETNYSVLIQHAPDLYTYFCYGHAKPTEFDVGDNVQTGEYIFESSKPGSGGPLQIYFEVRRSSHGDQVDPFTLFHPYAKMPGVTDPDQANLKVDGVLGEKTWIAWQDALKSNATWEFYSMIDGKPGQTTWKAIKQSVLVYYNETSLEPEEKIIIEGVQRKLSDSEFYDGPINGELDRETVAALQRALNAAKYR